MHQLGLSPEQIGVGHLRVCALLDSVLDECRMPDRRCASSPLTTFAGLAFGVGKLVQEAEAAARGRTLTWRRVALRSPHALKRPMSVGPVRRHRVAGVTLERLAISQRGELVLQVDAACLNGGAHPANGSELPRLAADAIVRNVTVYEEDVQQYRRLIGLTDVNGCPPAESAVALAFWTTLAMLVAERFGLGFKTATTTFNSLATGEGPFTVVIDRGCAEMAVYDRDFGKLRARVRLHS